MIRNQDVIKVGKILKTHALRGELNMILNIAPEYIEDGNPLIIEYEGILVPFFAESIRPKGTTSYLLKLSGVESSELASTFVNKDIFIQKKDLKNYTNENVIESDSIIGYCVLDSRNGNKIGEIVDIEDSTSNTLFILDSKEGEDIYLPANEDLIKSIDEESKVIIMEIPDGLIDLNKRNKL